MFSIQNNNTILIKVKQIAKAQNWTPWHWRQQRNQFGAKTIQRAVCVWARDFADDDDTCLSAFIAALCANNNWTWLIFIFHCHTLKTPHVSPFLLENTLLHTSRSVFVSISHVSSATKSNVLSFQTNEPTRFKQCWQFSAFSLRVSLSLACRPAMNELIKVDRKLCCLVGSAGSSADPSADYPKYWKKMFMEIFSPVCGGAFLFR